MNENIQYLCDNANLEAIKKLSAIQLPIKEMIIYLETKIEEYDNVFNNTSFWEIIKPRVNVFNNSIHNYIDTFIDELNEHNFS